MAFPPGSATVEIMKAAFMLHNIVVAAFLLIFGSYAAAMAGEPEPRLRWIGFLPNCSRLTHSRPGGSG